MKQPSLKIIRVLLILFPLLNLTATGQNVSFDALSQRFNEQVKPILSRHCLGCHSTEKMEGDLDLERFSSLMEVRKAPETWRHAREQITTGLRQMTLVQLQHGLPNIFGQKHWPTLVTQARCWLEG
jgi:hypothetical protein